MSVLRVTTFKDSQRSFLEALDERGIQYNRPALQAGAPMASGAVIEIVITGGWGTLAVACLAWASVRKSRKINVTTKDGQAIWLEGYSAEEAEKILGAAKQVVAIDTKPESDDEA